MSPKLPVPALALFLLATLTGACSSKKVVRVESLPPGADVSVFDPRTKTYVPVGKTPLAIDKDTKEFPQELMDESIWAMSVARPGHVVENIIFNRKTNPEYDIHLKLRPNAVWADNSSRVYSEMANHVGTAIQEINREIQAGKLDAALKAVGGLIDQYPEAPLFYDIKGSIYLLKGQKGDAVASYQKSLALNPDNVMTQKTLSDITGGKYLSLIHI